MTIEPGLYKFRKGTGLSFHIKTEGIHAYHTNNSRNYILVLNCNNNVPGYPDACVIEVWYPSRFERGEVLMHPKRWQLGTEKVPNAH